MHNTIKIKNFSLSFPNKVCFDDFSTDVAFGDRIAVIGKNGCGKSSLLKMIADQNQDLSLAYVPQTIENFNSLSGGERFNKSMSAALGENPSILLLDEPTNHLDADNRKSLMRMLNAYYGTLIVVTHDEELLQNCIDILWHIDNGKITVFRGKYSDYMRERSKQYQSVSRQMQLLEREKKSMHEKLMKEQQRAAKSKSSGEKKIANKKWMSTTADLKAMKAEKSQGKNLRNLDSRKQKLSEQLNEMRMPEVIVPKFHLPFSKTGDETIISIIDGAIGYSAEHLVASDINLSVMSHEHLAIVGKNGSGKTTLLKAIMNDPTVFRRGDWYVPKQSEIGYLDQHYSNLNPEQSALEIIAEANPSWTHAEIRRHLNDFLFRKNEEVNTAVKHLSGGEKARLSLAKIAANVPKLLILDEITNNIDLETKNHVAEVLQEYPAAMIIVSHDEIFLKKLEIDRCFQILPK